MYNINSNNTKQMLKIILEPVTIKGEKAIHQCVMAKS